MVGKKLKVTALRRAYQIRLVGLITNMPTQCVLFHISASSGFTIATLARIPAQTGPSCLHQDGQEVSGKHTTTGFKPARIKALVARVMLTVAHQDMMTLVTRNIHEAVALQTWHVRVSGIMCPEHGQ